MPGVDVTADLDNCKDEPLPLEDNSIEEIYASHKANAVNKKGID